MNEIDDGKTMLERIKKLYNVKSNKELAQKLEIKQNTVNTWSFREYVPFPVIKQIAIQKNVSFDWLLKGEEPTSSVLQNESGEIVKSNTSHNNTSNMDKTYKIERLSLSASAGSGIINYEVDTVDEIFISENFFKIPQDPKYLKLIQVEGDSMSPTLPNGCYVVIDVSKKNKTDGIYAINFDNEIFIKRLQFSFDGVIEIISDNPKYQTKYFNPNETDLSFSVIGRLALTILPSV